MPPAGEHSDGERARRGAPPQPAATGVLPARPALPPAAAAVLRLQRAYGNQAVRQAVQRLQPRTGGAGAGRSAQIGPRVQRWHDHEHDTSTQEGIDQAGAGQRLAQVFGTPSGGAPDTRYDTDDKVKTRLGDASVNMDRFRPQVLAGEGADKESHNVGRLPTLAMFGGSMFTSAVGRAGTQIGRGLGGLFGAAKPPAYKVGDPLPPRGILGEGPDHAESGYYKQSLGQTIPQNEAREDHYIAESIKALDQRPVTPDTIDEALNRLGDAAHVSADRGSHGEGAEGKGHDTPYPPQGLEGQTLMPYYMDSWEGNDDKGLNPAGYTYGVAKTAAMFGKFVGKAGTRGRPQPQLPQQAPQLPPRGTGHQAGEPDDG